MKLFKKMAWMAAVAAGMWMAVGTAFAQAAAGATAGAGDELKEIKKKYPAMSALVSGVEQIQRMRDQAEKSKSDSQKAALEKRIKAEVDKWNKRHDVDLKKLQDAKEKIDDEVTKLKDKAAAVKEKNGSTAALDKQIEAKEKLATAKDEEVTAMKTLSSKVNIR